MRRDDVKETDSIFPAPPIVPQSVELRLVRRVFIHAQSWRESGTDRMVYLGGLGPDSKPAEYAALGLVVQPMEKTWIPDGGDEKKQKGSWKQEVNYQSTFTLTCPPSFVTGTMRVEVRSLIIR